MCTLAGIRALTVLATIACELVNANIEPVHYSRAITSRITRKEQILHLSTNQLGVHACVRCECTLKMQNTENRSQHIALYMH